MLADDGIGRMGRPNSRSPWWAALAGHFANYRLAKKPSRTICSSIPRWRVVETVLASSLEPREGTVIGDLAARHSQTGWILALDAACTREFRNCQKSSGLPAASNWACNAWASAKSMLSPPSRMCSPTLTRSSSRTPSTSVTAIRLKSAVPPPTSQTRTISPGATNSRHVLPAFAVQA